MVNFETVTNWHTRVLYYEKMKCNNYFAHLDRLSKLHHEWLKLNPDISSLEGNKQNVLVQLRKQVRNRFDSNNIQILHTKAVKVLT